MTGRQGRNVAFCAGWYVKALDSSVHEKRGSLIENLFPLTNRNSTEMDNFLFFLARSTPSSRRDPLHMDTCSRQALAVVICK